MHLAVGGVLSLFLHHALFLVVTAAATLTQTLTGFAFGLVFLALMASFHLAPLPAAANVVNVMVLANAALLVRRRPQLPAGVALPIYGSSLVGVALGVALLGWISGGAVTVLRLLLGIAVLVCSLLLVVARRRRETVSGRASFAFYGGLSGVMGGLFASAGPPMVFQMYRQPLAAGTIRETLVLLFAVNAVLRLVLIVSQGRFDAASALLSIEALPVVLGLTWACQRHPPRLSPTAVKRVVFVLLSGAGLSLVLPALRLLFS
ncbi:TSUP family transporter [Robbsia sp. Bb-Pol-6]|uniref:Probable membrane transporter protein n=1 Tax=Robbsia betulipollinis TaxID=2981849 RepID=A0ABT3ZIU8_9BURK|nr:TSUP family transporter [Robbsia betulipollinis]MCY0386235.1 TSUP family transporter [Robbsia betulipollinis]